VLVGGRGLALREELLLAVEAAAAGDVEGDDHPAPPPREPSTRSPALGPEEQVVADPERAAGSGRHLLGFEVRMVGALQSADVVVVSAEHVRGARQELEIPASSGAARSALDSDSNASLHAPLA
jgi:hypothetical protein